MRVDRWYASRVRGHVDWNTSDKIASATEATLSLMVSKLNGGAYGTVYFDPMNPVLHTSTKAIGASRSAHVGRTAPP